VSLPESIQDLPGKEQKKGNKLSQKEAQGRRVIQTQFVVEAPCQCKFFSWERESPGTGRFVGRVKGKGEKTSKSRTARQRRATFTFTKGQTLVDCEKKAVERDVRGLWRGGAMINPLLKQGRFLVGLNQGNELQRVSTVRKRGKGAIVPLVDDVRCNGKGVRTPNQSRINDGPAWQ